MKIRLIITGLCMAFMFTAFAQEEEPVVDKPVRAPWESGYLIDQQTPLVPYKGTLEFVIHHRFGAFGNGTSDLFGIWAPSNIRLGLNYSFSDKFQLGLGSTKFKKFTDLTYKYNILEQTRSGAVPVAVTFWGNIGLDGRNDEFYGSEYAFTQRFSYFNQLIVARKFTNALSVQVAPSFLHYNMVDSLIEHDKFAVSFGARYKITPTMAIIANYDLPLHFKGIQEYYEITDKPYGNFGIGIEISTSTHAFQIFLGSSDKILPQENILYNQNNFWDKGILLGFNMTRLWSF